MSSQKVEDAAANVEQTQDSSNMVELNEVPEIQLFLKLIIVVTSQANQNQLMPPLTPQNSMKTPVWPKRTVYNRLNMIA